MQERSKNKKKFRIHPFDCMIFYEFCKQFRTICVNAYKNKKKILKFTHTFAELQKNKKIKCIKAKKNAWKAKPRQVK